MQSSLILLSDINLGDAHVIHYRTEIFKQGKLFVAATRAFFVSFAVILSCLTARAIQVEKKKVPNYVCFVLLIVIQSVIYVFLESSHG